MLVYTCHIVKGVVLLTLFLPFLDLFPRLFMIGRVIKLLAIATISGANLNGYQFFSVLNNIR